MKADISLEIRSGSGGEEHWAFVEVPRVSSVYALVQVRPLVLPPAGGPRYITFTEDSPPTRIHSDAQLEVREENAWREAWPNLRVRGLNLTLAEGFVPDTDLLELQPTDGWEGVWHAEEGRLEVRALAGWPWTEDAVDDYEDSHVEEVDVSEVLARQYPAASIAHASAVLRRVTFATTEEGHKERVVQLHVTELLTAAKVANIVWIGVLNSPDPPVVAPSPDIGVFVEKAPAKALDPSIQA